MGVPAPLRDEAIAWATTALSSEVGWPGVFRTLAAAQKALRRFFPGDPDARLIGLGLEDSMTEDFIAEASASGETTYLDAVKARQPLPDGGARLGYELLDLEFGQLSHSWLCNSLEQHCADVPGIRPNPSGLIESFDDARRCCDEIGREEVGAEPGYWFPVALIDYTTS